MRIFKDQKALAIIFCYLRLKEGTCFHDHEFKEEAFVLGKKKEKGCVGIFLINK